MRGTALLWAGLVARGAWARLIARAGAPAAARRGDLPCDLWLDFDVELVEGGRAFKVVARCTAAVSDAVLSFDAPRPEAVRYADLSFDSLEGRHAWVLAGPFRVSGFMGYSFSLSANASSGPVAASVTLDEAALPPPVSEGTLPCRLTLDASVACSVPCFDVRALCSEDVREVALEIPGHEEKLYHDLHAGEEYLLATLPRADHAGGRLRLVGSCGGSSRSVSSAAVPA